MKKSTKLVSAVVVLAVLGGVYVGLNTYVSKEEKTESSEEESKTEVFSVKTDDIKSLEFIVDKKEVTFEKKDDSWVKKDETAFPVNQTTLDSAASAIKKVEADRVLEDVEDLTEYGLDSPSNTVTVDTADGTTKLNIGDENTSTNQYYISKDDDDSTVYVVAADTVSPFMNSLYDYAQGEDFPTIDSSTVKKVQVSENKDSYVLEENSDGATWNVSGDGSSDKESADTTAAGNVTSGLGSFAFDQFVNYNAEDLSQYGVYDEAFPGNDEKRMFRCLEEGNEEGMLQEVNFFCDWMVEHYSQDMNNIRLKILEFIIWGEKIAFESGAINYGFSYRRDYLDTAMSLSTYEDLRKWFQEKMVNVCRAIRDQKEDQSNSAVKKAMLYIQENYSRDISLDDVSSQVNISPYYFSKIFKEETGENFIEYLTRVRIDKAKELLVDANVSVKEAGIQSGYSDPNYFSRIFKKQMDMTPSEYKARYGK